MSSSLSKSDEQGVKP